MTGKSEITRLRQKLDEESGKKSLLTKQLEQIEEERSEKVLSLENHQKARAIVQIVAEQTQKQIEFHISNLVSLALASVFPDPYEFKLSFVPRRNKTECDLLFTKRGKESDDILFTGGGGVADIASIALKIACWSIKKTRPFMLFDEPLKYLHNPVYQEKASELFKRISEELKIQIILVSDQEAIVKAADKVFDVINIKGVAKVTSQISQIIR
jgi:hypothetical protein